MIINSLLALHAFVGILAFGLLPFPGILAKPMIAAGDVRTIRSVFSVLVVRAKFAGPLAVLAALLGLWLVHAMGYSYTAGWLVVSYVAFVLLVGIGIGVHSRWEQRVLATAQAVPDGAVTAELTTVLDDKTNASLHLITLLCWFALFYFMIVRP